MAGEATPTVEDGFAAGWLAALDLMAELVPALGPLSASRLEARIRALRAQPQRRQVGESR
jgi:hypothetical protein